MNVEQKALELVNAVRAERGLVRWEIIERLDAPLEEALCRAIEAHEADKHRFSEAAAKVVELLSKIAEDACLRSDYPWHSGNASNARLTLSPFILAPVDLLVEALADALCRDDCMVEPAERLRAALDARGLAIVKKEAVNG